VQYWNGSSWTTIPGGSVTGNNKVWRKFTFSPITTSKIRVWINQVPDSWSRVVEIQAFGTSAGGEKVQWLVPDHLGTPRIVLDQTGNLAGVKRHDYLPFGEELFAGTGGRTTAQGYTGDGVRQQFTSKERDIETGLDYFGARYYASMQGRFTGVDPYDINFERQETEDRQEADALFRNYLSQPQHWNRYAYALNNPLKYVDPDGLYEYEAELLGKKIKVHIDDSIIKKDKDALNRIKDNLQKTFDKINAGADKLTKEQKESIGSMKGISVSRSGAIGMNGGTFQITQRMAENPNVDKLSADIIHDSRHAEQAKRGLSYNEETAIPMEMEASQFAVGVMNSIGGWDPKVLRNYERDAATGHLPNRKWKDKSTLKSRTRVFEKMKGPRN
jgi:RHS repeat-associated protein